MPTCLLASLCVVPWQVPHGMDGYFSQAFAVSAAGVFLQVCSGSFLVWQPHVQTAERRASAERDSPRVHHGSMRLQSYTEDLRTDDKKDSLLISQRH